jgi:hypothetical protein
MDEDAFSVFGVAKPRTPQQEQWHREMERRSFDIIRVKNPDTVDFFVEWDHRFQRVPAGGTADMARFWAVTYCRNKAVDIINKMGEKLHKEDLEERAKKGLPSYKDKNEEQNETYMTQRYPKTNDRALLTKLYSELWVGLVYEYGKDVPSSAPQDARAGEVDLTPLEQKILMELENRRVDLKQEEKPIVQPVTNVPRFDEPSKEETLKEVTVDDTQGQS